MANADLLRHSAEQFSRCVVETAPGIWTAVGFAASTQHMIEGRGSVTIVDTSESTDAARNVLAAFRERCDKPVGRILYTHSHRDHVGGTSVFAGGRDLPIIASARFRSDLAGDAEGTVPRAALKRRTLAQFGFGLAPEERVSLGIGPGDRPTGGMGEGFVAPTRLIEEDCAIDLDGVEARLLMTPGETDDHMAVWLPAAGVLLPGDNWYHAFPNLYAIRGTPYRDFGAWARSLETLEALGAEAMAPGHTMPVIGAAEVRQVLSTTRQAILHVMRHTAGAMDAGRSMDDIAASIRLPEHLAALPWLGEYYGKASWSARAYAVGTLGWYDGNPTHLGTLADGQRAAHLAALAGGEGALMDAARAEDDPQWRLELCDALIALGRQEARALKARTLDDLAEDEINAAARNSYLWHARKLREGA